MMVALLPQQGDTKQAQIVVAKKTAGCATCPETDVTINGTGAIKLFCAGACAVPGSHDTTVSEGDVAELVRAFEAADLFAMPKQSGECDDCEVVTFVFKLGARTADVRVAGPLPESLSALDLAIRTLIAPVRRFMAATPDNYQEILNTGAGIDAPIGADKRTLLYYALAAGNASSVRFLLDKGALMNADVAQLAGKSAPPVVDSLWSAAHLTGSTEYALMMMLSAAASNRGDTIDWLMRNGVSVDAHEAKTGRTPLMAAASTCAADAIDTLLEARADITLRDTSGRNALAYVGTAGGDAAGCAAVRQRLGGWVG